MRPVCQSRILPIVNNIDDRANPRARHHRPMANGNRREHKNEARKWSTKWTDSFDPNLVVAFSQREFTVRIWNAESYDICFRISTGSSEKRLERSSVMWRGAPFIRSRTFFVRRSKKAKKASISSIIHHRHRLSFSFIIEVLLVLNFSHHVLNPRKYLLSESSVCNDDCGSLIADSRDAR
jgi:ribosomal protein L18